jgi:hypothetical protein
MSKECNLGVGNENNLKGGKRISRILGQQWWNWPSKMKPIARVILKHDDMDESYQMDECLWHPSYGWNESQERESRFIEIDNMNNEMYYRDEIQWHGWNYGQKCQSSIFVYLCEAYICSSSIYKLPSFQLYPIWL